MLELLGASGSILLADLVLSGDNALVIGATAARLPRRQRRSAILFGGAGAIVLRISIASLVSFLLLLPWLQAIGGLILLVIAIRLLLDRHSDQSDPREEQADPSKTEQPARKASQSFFSAMLTILVADVTMSTDNVLAVGALSQGNLLVLSLGLFFSIAVLLISSTLIAEVMKWLPWLLDIAALVLAWTGANMLLHDLQLGELLQAYAWTSIAVPAVALGFVLLVDLLLRIRDHKAAHSPLA